jgi:hypothetical protein
MESKLAYAKITQEWDDSFMIKVDNYPEELYLKSDFGYNKAIEKYITDKMPADKNYYVLTPGGEVISSVNKEWLKKNQVVTNQEQLTDVINSLFFSLSRDHSKCIVSSTQSPAKEYVIADWTNDGMVLDYIVSVMNIVVPSNLIMPTINFNDDM